MRNTTKKKRDYAAEYARRPRWSKLCGWYKSEDRKQGRENNLTSEQVRILISLPCFWCGKEESGGLDRKDNSLGHIINDTADGSNVVPSCYKCNMIFGDLPYDAKTLMRPTMQKLRESGVIENWDPPNPFNKNRR